MQAGVFYFTQSRSEIGEKPVGVNATMSLLHGHLYIDEDGGEDGKVKARIRPE